MPRIASRSLRSLAFATLAALAVVPSPRAQEAGLVGHWTFDEGAGVTAADSSPSGLVADLSNGAAWAPGVVGGALSVDGVDDIVEIDDSGSGHPLDLTAGLTIAFWINPATQTQGNDKVVAKNNAYELQIDAGQNGRWNLRLNNGIVTHATTKLKVSTWQHVAATWDGANVVYYLDGNADGGYVVPGPLVSNDNDIGIGARPSNSSGQLYMVHGLIDDVRIYDRALDVDEIRDLVALASGSDTTPPLLANGQPSGVLPAGTESVTLSLDTDERAICRFDDLPGTSFAAMPVIFENTDTTTHSHLLTGLESGRSYIRYVRCEDLGGNANTVDFEIVFSILAETAIGFHPTDLQPLMFYVDSTFFEDFDNRARAVATCHTQDCYDLHGNSSSPTPITQSYCDTVVDENAAVGARGVAPNGCVRRWEDQSGYVSMRMDMFPGELLTGRDFGQDDLEKPVLVPNCVNGRACARGVPSSLPDPTFEQNTSFEIEGADACCTGNPDVVPSGTPNDLGLYDDFSLFHLVKPTGHADDFYYFGCGPGGLRHNVADNSLDYLCGGGCVGSGTATRAGAMQLDAWQLIEVHRDATGDIQVLVDGQDVTAPVPVNSVGPWCFNDVMSRFKGEQAFFGDWAASAVYDRHLDETERTDVRSYLNGVYGLDGTVPRPPTPPVARGYQGRGCSFDMDDDLVYGEPEDCNVGDGVTVDPDGDGVAEDLIYVDCDAGSDVAGDGSPANPFATLGHAFQVADGPSDGAEDIVVFAGICSPDEASIPVSGLPGFKVRPRTGSEERDFQYPRDPMMLIGWDRDDDGLYPPFDTDDVAVLDGGAPHCLAYALGYDIADARSFIEVAHFEVRGYGTCEGDEIPSGFFIHESKSNQPSTHHYFHDIVMRDVNRAAPNGETATIVHNMFSGGYMRWFAFENEAILDASGYSYRGSTGTQDGESGPFRFQGSTRTCFANGIRPDTGTLCSGWKVWNHVTGVEIIDQVFDMNFAAGWTQKNDTAANAIGVSTCMQDVVVRNNLGIDSKTFVTINGYDDQACNQSKGITPRPTRNVRIEGNVWRNTHDWSTNGNAAGGCIGLSACNSFESSIQDVVITNNFCSSATRVSTVINMRCNQDVGENPGQWTFSGNTLVAEQGASLAVFNHDTNGGVFGEDDVRFQNNILVTTAGERAFRLPRVIADLESDYNTISPGVKFIWDGEVHLTLADWQAATGGDAASRECEPAFQDLPAGDLHLDPADSCALDRGIALAAITLGDIDGAVRPGGQGWDIGADEVAGGTAPPPPPPPPADTTPPALSIDTPPPPTSLTQILLDGDASDNVGVTSVEWVNSTTGQTGTATGCGGETSCSWTTSSITLVEGANLLRVTARDAAGNTSEDTATITHTPADTTPPVISMNAPPSSTPLTQIQLDGDASDNVGVISVEWVNSTTGQTGAATGCNGEISCSWTTSSITLVEGANLLSVTARDAAGNTSEDTATITHTPVDTTPPVISMNAPPSSTPLTQIQLDGNASDNVGVISVEWVNSTTGQTGAATGCNGETSCSWTTSSITLDEGANLLRVIARDTAGNTSEDTATVVHTSADTTPPVISDLVATTNTGATVTITISWTTDEPATTAVDYGTTTAYGDVASDGVLKTDHAIVLDCLARKTTYHFRPRARDAAGNEAIGIDNTIRTEGKPPKGSCP